MNKAELIDALEAKLGSKKVASDALEAFLDVVIREVARGGKVGITGFGTFERADRAARTGRNPKTGATVKIKKTRVPKFRSGTNFKEVVSGAKKLSKTESAASQEPEILMCKPEDNMSHADKPPTPNFLLSHPSPTDHEAGEKPKPAPAAAPTETDVKKAAAEAPKTGAVGASVGRGGKNHKSDVKAVQEKLNARGLDTGGVDGVPTALAIGGA